MISDIVIFILISSTVFCQEIERAVIADGQAFQFDCRLDESIYFARQLNDWKEITENDETYAYLNLKYTHLSNENVLRVTVDSAQSKHVGFYACRKASWTSTAMSSIYQLTLAEVQSFYWTYICHGPTGSCQRTTTIDQLEIADETYVDFYCCASVKGYEKLNIHMNMLGTNQDKIDVKTKSESDGSSVICANQYTKFTKRLSSQQMLTCELFTDDRSHSTLSSLITIKDAIKSDIAAEWNSNFDSDQNVNNPYFNFPSHTRRRSRRITRFTILLTSLIASLLALIFVIVLLICILRKKQTKASRTNNTPIVKQYSPVQISESSSAHYVNIHQDIENPYEEPIPLPRTKFPTRR